VSDPPEAVLEARMDTELASLRAEQHGRPGHPRNPVFLHEQGAGSAVAADEATGTAARVTGELAAQSDQERLEIEGQVAAIDRTAPGSAAAPDAEQALARAEHDADEAVTESLDSDEAAEDARRATGSHLFHRGADPSAGKLDEARALRDETVVARDLAELDALEQRVAADASATPSPS
jgi:hypothetical protein